MYSKIPRERMENILQYVIEYIAVKNDDALYSIQVENLLPARYQEIIKNIKLTSLFAVEYREDIINILDLLKNMNADLQNIKYIFIGFTNFKPLLCIYNKNYKDISSIFINISRLHYHMREEIKNNSLFANFNVYKIGIMILIAGFAYKIYRYM